MFLHDRPLENFDKKIYRFALFGVSGSGKTSFLTALGMVCRPTTDGSCCSHLPAHRLASPEIQEGWVTLQEHVWKLCKTGELPKSTEVKRGHYTRYRYEYTDSKVGTAYFEVIDYSGGLTHHSHIRHEDCTELLEHLIEHKIDAIIVLVSAPKEGQEQSDIPDEIATISKTFNFLQGHQMAERRYPIALALTKWDRRWERDETIPSNDTGAEAGRLAQFMVQCTAYQEVRDILQGFAGSDESFKMFPVSALGRCSDDRSPDKVPLESYGLPFVFGWLIQAANDSDFRRFEKMQSELPWWQVLPLVPRVLAKHTPAWTISTWKKWTQPVQETWSLGKSLLNRLPETKEGEEKRTAVKSVKKRLSMIWRLQLLLLTAMLFLVALLPIGVRVSDAYILSNATTFVSALACIMQDLSKDYEEAYTHPEAYTQQYFSRIEEIRQNFEGTQQYLDRVNSQLDRIICSSPYTVLLHGRGKERKQVAQNLLDRISEIAADYTLSLILAVPLEAFAIIQELGQSYLTDLSEFHNEDAREKVFDRMNKAKDKLYYDAVRIYRTRPVCDVYLNDAPRQTMRQEVERYLAYIDEMEGAINLTVTATLHVSDTIFWADDSRNSFILSVNGTQRISIANFDEQGFNANQAMVLDQNPFNISGKLMDTLNISANMQYTNVLGIMDQVGGTKVFTIGNLQQSQSLTLTSTDDSNASLTLTFSATGFPPEPPLPDWSP